MESTQQSDSLSPEFAPSSRKHQSGSRSRRRNPRSSASLTLTLPTLNYPRVEESSSCPLTTLCNQSIILSRPGSSPDPPEPEHEPTVEPNDSISQASISSFNSLRSQVDESDGTPDKQSVNSGNIVGVAAPPSVPGNGDLEACGGSISSNVTEATTVERRLGTFDVAALIINKQIGSGVFTTPGLVLSLTKSKSVALGLWVVGGVYTALCLLIYLEFGIALPFNGGELIYLDEVFPVPELLATVLFSGFYLVLGSNAGNALAFAKHILIAASPSIQTTQELDKRLVSFIAISVLTLVCLLHYFSAKLGLFLNKWFAIYKILLLVACFVAGVIARNKSFPGVPSGVTDFLTTQPGYTTADNFAALVYVLYSYQGWENANYVAGEIRAAKDSPKKTLASGAFLAVGIVCVLYVLVTLGYYLAVDYATITSTYSDLGMVVLFAPKAFGSSFNLKIGVACSALGNLIAVTYTSVKVKQAIAIQRVIPFYRFFAADDRQFGTPRGALILHWVFTVIIILITPDTTDGYAFVVGLFTYGHILIGVFIGLGFFRLRKRMATRQRTAWKPSYLTNKHIGRAVAVIFIATNLVILVRGAQAPATISRYWWTIVTMLIFAGSLMYWSGLRLLQWPAVGKRVGLEVKVHSAQETMPPREMVGATRMVMDAGSRRRVEYMISGPTKYIRTKVCGLYEFVVRTVC